MLVLMAFLALSSQDGAFAREAASIPIDDSQLDPSRRSCDEAQRARKIFRDELSKALAAVHAALGLRYPKNESFKILLVDENKGDSQAVTHVALKAGDFTHIKVFLPGWTSRKKEEDLRSLVTHEMVHALQGLAMGGAAYAQQPAWFREALAVQVSGQGASKLRWALQKCGGKLEPILDGFAEEDGKAKLPEDYAEGWIGLEYLESSLGAAGYRKFLAMVIEEKVPVQQAVAKSTQKSFKEFETAAHEFARKNHEKLLKK